MWSSGRAALAAALGISMLGLSGCSDDGAPAAPTAVDSESFELKAGKGAISGLLVDDRFRPIHLTAEDATTEFQARGFVLLQETGAQVLTTVNGEFSFVDLDPGTYTLRVTATGHEATPTQVTVAEGVFNEASIVARRTASQGSTVITEEYSAFVPCMASLPAVTAQCVVIPPDQSGDTHREDFWTNYTGLPDVTYAVIELRTNHRAENSGATKIVARNATNDCYVVNDSIVEGDYMKVWMQNGEVSPFDIEKRNCRWTNEDRQLVQMWAQGLFKEETRALIFGTTCLAGAYCDAESRGIGVRLGLKGQFLVSVFLGPPDVDIESYCALCGES
jgi:hypothetical protein